MPNPKPTPTLLYILAEQFSPADAPDIPLPDDVDREGLRTALGGGDLVFDVRPIGKVGLSRNDVMYGERSVRNLVAQVNTRRVEGRWGHLRWDELDSTYEEPAIRWLAAQYDERTQTAWGLLVALTPEAKRYLLAAKATNARTGTSIFGFDPVYEGGEVIDYRLVTIDLANAERVGVPDTAFVPVARQEMVSNSSPKEDIVMPETTPPQVVAAPAHDRVQELEVEVRRLKAGIESYEQQIGALRPRAEEFDAIARHLGNTDDPLKVIRQQQTQIAALTAENAQLLEDRLAALVASKVALESVRPLVVLHVKQHNPATRKELERAVDAVLEMPEIKTFLATTLTTETGGAQGRPVTPPTRTDEWKRYVVFPE